MKKKIIILLFLSFTLIAQTIFGASGIGVRPLRTSVELNPGESKDIFLTIINNEKFTQTVVPEFQTYISHDNSGYPIAKNLKKDDPRNINSWISFEEEKSFIKAASERSIKVTIKAPENAEPGGRYGALIYGPVLDSKSGISFRTRVASLLLITVKGDEKFDGEIKSFSLKNDEMLSDKSVSFTVDFKNDGNIHTAPRGTITIYDEKEEKILNIFSFFESDGEEKFENSIPVNPYSNYVLPNISRIYESTWINNIKEGSYNAKLNFTFKKGKQEITEKRNLEFEIKNQIEVVDFEFVSENKKSFFILKLKNTGTVNEKIRGEIEILNELESWVGNVKIPKDVGYVEVGEEKEFKFKFLDKELPKGKYTTSSKVFYGYEDKKLNLVKNFGSNGNDYVLYLIFLLIILLVWKKDIIIKKIKR